NFGSAFRNRLATSRTLAFDRLGEDEKCRCWPGRTNSETASNKPLMIDMGGRSVRRRTHRREAVPPRPPQRSGVDRRWPCVAHPRATHEGVGARTGPFATVCARTRASHWTPEEQPMWG